MKALVTGASGFLGSTLIEELGTLGFEVHAMMRSTSSPANLAGLKYRRVEGDLSDEGALRRAAKEVDYVFHLAGLTVAPSRAAFFESNAQGTARVARAVADARPGLTRFVYVSSLAAAGPALTLDPRTENQESKPVSAYGESKLKGETELLKFKSVYPISIIRPPAVYGPKDKAMFLLMQTVARNLMPLMKGGSKSGQKYYSIIHAEDLCRGIVQAGLVTPDKVPSGEVFYLANDQFHTYQEVMTAIAERLDRQPIKIKVPRFAIIAAAAGLTAAGWATRRTFPLNWDKLQEVLPDYWICSNQKAKRVLGFAPEFDLSSGMAQAIEWYKKQKWL